METAVLRVVLRVLSDILFALDSGNIAVLASLDLSAAFDSVNHATLLQHLRTSCGLGGSVIAWFTSSLNNQTNMCGYLQAGQLSRLCCTESCRSLDQSCSYCTLPTCRSSCKVINSIHMRMLMTLKSMDYVTHLMLNHFSSISQHVLTKCRNGWRATGCN